MEKQTERKFAWEIWRDPLNSNLKDVEWPGHEPKNDKVEFYDFADENTAAVKNVDEEFMKNLGKKIHSISPIKVVNTKMGLLTVTENALAANHFEFWILHTNFDITEEVAETICKSRGVDAFIPLTRYRCRIGFPTSKLFVVSELKLEIQKNIIALDEAEESSVNIEALFDEETTGKIESKITELKGRSKYWALYVLPNGNMEALESDLPNNVFSTKLKILEESQKLVGGKVYRS